MACNSFKVSLYNASDFYIAKKLKTFDEIRKDIHVRKFLKLIVVSAFCVLGNLSRLDYFQLSQYLAFSSYILSLVELRSWNWLNQST